MGCIRVCIALVSDGCLCFFALYNCKKLKIEECDWCVSSACNIRSKSIFLKNKMILDYEGLHLKYGEARR